MASYEGTAVPLICGRVTHIVDPGDFWLRMGSETDLVNFDEFEHKLNPALRQLPVGKTDGVAEGSTVLVCCSKQDGRNTTQWRRATVIRIDWNKNMFDVLYMDYGYSEIVPATSICHTVPEDIALHPVSCIRCALAGIKPIAKSWTNRGVKMFEKLALKKTLKVALVSYNHLTLSHRVALYHSERSITHQMLEAETGLQTEEKVEEFAMDVVPVSYEDFYGCNPYDQLPSGECAQPNPDSSTSEQTINEEAGRHQTNSTSCDTSSTDTEWDAVSDDAEDDQRTQLHESDTGNGQSRTAPGGLSVDCEARGRETASQFDTRDTDSKDRSPACEIVVPGFNLTVFQTRRMLNAEELQREREEAVRAERKAKLQKDMVECHRDLELTNPMMGQGQGQKWGNSDLLISQISEENETEVFNQVVPVSSPAPLNDHAGAFDKDKKDTNFDNHNVNNMDEVEETAEILPEITSLEHHVCDEQNHRKSPITAGPSDGVEYVMHSPQPDKRVKERDPLPPRTQLSAEEEEYHKQKQYKEILHEGVDQDGSDVVCAQFHSLVPLISDPGEDEVKVLMQVVLEEAVRQAKVTDLALEVIASYSGVLRGTDLLCLLKSTCEKFVKLPVAKMQKHHRDFALLLTKLFYLSLDWPPLLKTVVEDFIMQQLEKWIIFNKKGSQTGLIQRHVEEVYLDCAEVVLLHCSPILQASDSERFQLVFDEMREKVLETNVEYQARSRLLTILIRYSNPHLETGTIRDEEEDEPPQVKKATKDQAVQSDTTPSSPATSLSSDSCAHRSTLTVESSSQTDAVAMAGGDVEARMDVSAQTDWVGELPFASRRTSSGSVDGPERVDTVVAAPGRARRRRAVVEHLTKKESTGSSSRPDTKVFLSAAASVLCRQSSLASEPSDGERDGGLETAQSPRDAGYSATSRSSEESLIPQGKSSNPVPGFTVMEDKSKASEHHTCTLHGNENNSNNSSQPAVPNTSTGACESHEQEEWQNEGVPESPSSSFFSAVSSMSKSAWQSVFGSEVDADSYLKLKADEMESLNSSSTMSLDGNDSSVRSKESKAKSGEGEAAKTRGKEEDEEQKRVEEEGGEVVAEEKHQAEGCKGREEEKKWSSFTHVDTDMKGTPYQGGERGSMVEDFPHLTHQMKTSTRRTPTPPPLTQLSLQTIAAGLLRPDPEPASEERARSQELRNGQSQKDRRSEGDYKSSAHRNKIIEMGVCDVEFNYTEDDNGSIPSDWEDRASPSTDRPEQKEYGVHDDPSEQGETDPVSHGPFHHWLGGGDGFGDGRLVSGQLPVLDNAGDSAASDSAFLLQSSYMSEAHSVKEDSHQYVASSDEMGDREKTPERYFSPLTGRPLSPVLDPGSGGDRQDNASRGRRRSVTSESDDAAVLTGNAVPYERGDLGFMAKTGKKKKKTVFRPFEHAPFVARAKPSPAREMWVPTSFFCTNCDSEGHIRSECTQPLGNGLIN